jgi:hypothetical protein
MLSGTWAGGGHISVLVTKLADGRIAFTTNVTGARGFAIEQDELVEALLRWGRGESASARNCQGRGLPSVVTRSRARLEPDMIVDCDRCEVRGSACQDCVITVLLGAPPGGVELDGTERRALDTLAKAGMVPRLQLIDRRDGRRAPRGGADADAQLRKGAERHTDGDERSRRRVS